MTHKTVRFALLPFVCVLAVGCAPPERHYLDGPVEAIATYPQAPQMQAPPSAQLNAMMCYEPGRMSCAEFYAKRAFLAACEDFDAICEAAANGKWCQSGYTPVMRDATLPRPPSCYEGQIPVCGAAAFVDCCTINDKPLDDLPKCSAQNPCESALGECVQDFCTQYAAEDATPDDGEGYCVVQTLGSGTPCSIGACYKGICVQPDDD